MQKEERKNLSTSDRLKLAKEAKEGGADKFTFFDSEGQTGGDFRTPYNLHILIEALSNEITFCDIGDVFKMLPSDKITVLENKFEE